MGQRVLERLLQKFVLVVVQGGADFDEEVDDVADRQGECRT